MKKKLLSVSTGAAAALVIIIFGLNEYVLRTEIEPSLEQIKELQRGFLAAARQDQAVLLRHNPFPKLYTEQWQRSAGPFLNTKIVFSGQMPESARLHLGLPQGSDEKLELDWTQRSYREFGTRLDFAWLKTIQKYDHWSLWDSGPLSKWFNDPDRLLVEMPFPVFADIEKWAKLRLLHSLSRDDSRQAAKEIRHLAKLLLSNENHNSTQIAISLLTIEREFYEKWNKKVANLPDPVAEIFTTSARRHSTYNRAAFNPIADAKVRAEFLEQNRNLFGWCGALFDGIAINELVPLNKNILGMGAAAAEIDLARGHSGCRHDKIGARKRQHDDPILRRQKDVIRGQYSRWDDVFIYLSFATPRIRDTAYGAVFSVGMFDLGYEDIADRLLIQ